MKNRFSKPMMVAFVCVISIFLCVGLYYFIDVVLNGSFVDWFERNYMLTEKKFIQSTGETVELYRPDFMKIKGMLLWTLVVGVTAVIILVAATAFFYSRMRVKGSITRTSHMIRRFMDADTIAADIFPKEYTEISMQMIEIRTAMERHEQILKEEASRKNDLIAYLAHDLKTPLTSVIGYLSLLDEASDMPAVQRAKYVRITLDKANRLEKLINEFFDITRYNLQQIEIEKETIDLYYMLMQMTDEFYPLLQSHGNTVELDVDENMTVYGDAVKLARVFNNILKNAVAYSYPDTTVKIWARQTNETTEIHFCNHGKTITPHKLDMIFEKFFRLDDARTTNTGGAGLGLAIAREIVNLHGGSITAKSENEMTTFCVSLPRRSL